MAEEAIRPRLGRGLAALIGDVGDESAVVERVRGQRRVPVEFLRPNPRNPRKSFREEDLAELAGSIRQRGIVQPIIVRSLPNLPDVFEIVAGERRWRAAQMAGLHDVPVAVVDIDDKTSLEYAIIENVQRADLNAIEEAAGYQRLIEEHGYTQTDLATTLGKSRSHLANTLRLLQLPESVRTLVAEGQLSPGHARALLSLADPEATARKVVKDNLTVRDVERLAQQANQPAPETKSAFPLKKGRDKDPDTRAVEKALEDVLGLKVAIEHRGQGGEVKIVYRTLEQLDALCRRLRDSAAR